MKEAHDHHRVTPEGRALGEQMVRFTEPIIKRLEAEGEPDDRCASCAFRPGTVPNGCAQTQMDALKAVMEDVPFLCHSHAIKGNFYMPCWGWFAARQVVKGKTPCPWEFSPEEPEGDNAKANGSEPNLNEREAVAIHSGQISPMDISPRDARMSARKA